MSMFGIDEDWVRLTCSRCGVEETVMRNTVAKRLLRGEKNWSDCVDCEFRKGRKFAKRGGDCIPHKGELDENLFPLNKFLKPYRPGLRVCGNSDCVRREHIVEVNA